MPYRAINADSVIDTIDRLQRRIDERFSGRGISAVCREVGLVARKDRDRVVGMQHPYRWVRVGVVLVFALGLLSLLFLLREVNFMQLLHPNDEEDVLGLFQGLDSAVNIVVLFGVFLFFLLRHEERDKQKLALEDLYELRSLAHVIDMHQLTKDPTTLMEENTPASPPQTMTRYELVRYLDYCSELLSLVGKIAALYSQDVRDPVVIESVSDLEAMTTNLSRKIWQKIMLLEQMDAARAS